MMTFDSELSNAQFVVRNNKGVPKLFGRPADEISEAEVDQVVRYGQDCISRRSNNSDGYFSRYFDRLRGNLMAIVDAGKSTVRQERETAEAKARLLEQEAVVSRRREDQHAAELVQEARQSAARKLENEKREREESERQLRLSREHAEQDQSATADLRKQLEIERRNLEEATKIAEGARREREVVELELSRVRQQREEMKSKPQSSAPPPVTSFADVKPTSSQPEKSDLKSSNTEGSEAEGVNARTITSDNHFGCRSWDTYERLGTIAASGDRAAFGRLLTSAVLGADCTLWKKSAKVFVDDGGFASSCIRKAGDTFCYWTANEAIRRIQ